MLKKMIVSILFAVFLVGAVLAWKAISFLSTAPSKTKTEIIFEVPTGTAFYQVSQGLYRQGLITDEFMFRVMAKILRQTTRLKVGEYRLSTDMGPRAVLAMLTSGNSISYSLTVPEGFNIYEIRILLNNLWQGRGDEFFKLIQDKKFITQLTSLSDLSSLEGYLFPETYILTKYTPMEALVRRMYEGFQKNINEVNGQSPKVKLDLREQLILASVIEKETGAPEERPLISSVFHNRLRRGMRLQSDPTILYGILAETGEYTKNIKKSDILRPTPYNTYTVKALPVGPIANPGKAALWAAVNPVDSNYLYFVSKNDGTHIFSETYAEHDKAVKSYQLDRKAREGRSWRDLNLKKNEQK